MTHFTYNQEEVQELFDVVFKLSAKDINDKLIKVRNRPNIAQRRWFWELVQNAKDSVKPAETVDVILEVFKNEENIPFVSFSHNGNPFKYQDAKNLIFPYSEKEEEETDNTGRFGTGFLATHILSKKIFVKGVYIKDDNAYDFYFTLDRSATDKRELAELISKTWQSFREKRKIKESYAYNQNDFETKFIYPIDNEKIEFVNNSINDIQYSLPFVLSFIPKINSVRIINNLTNDNIKFELNEKKTVSLSNEITKYIIEKTYFNDESIVNMEEISIVLCTDKIIDIGIEIKEINNKIIIKNLPEKQPILFCSFPLIDANEFPFPITINSAHFIPKEERNGIWLGDSIEGATNKKLFERVIPLFKNLTDYISTHNWSRTYLLYRTFKNRPNFPDLNIEWYINNIQKPLKDFLFNSKLVDNPLGDRINFSKINFPANEDPEIREYLWDLFFRLYDTKVPLKNEIHEWYNVIWSRGITLEGLAVFITKQKYLTNLCKIFNNEIDQCISWLNDFISLISKVNNSLFNAQDLSFLPNQFGQFKKKNELYIDDGTIDETLKDILKLISNFNSNISDWRNELLDRRIKLEHFRIRSIEDIAKIITDNVKEFLKKEDPSNDLQDLFSLLLNWLNDNPNIHKKYFTNLKIDTLLYKTTKETKLKHFTELLKKDRNGYISIEEINKLDPKRIELLNDPDFELIYKLGAQVLAERKREIQEFEFKKATGNLFEKLFYEIINSDNMFSIRKVEGEEDFIITVKSSNVEFYIELKSIGITTNIIQMTHKQAKKAYNYKSNYILCYIQNINNSKVDLEYFISNARFDTNIGNKLSKKVQEALIFEKTNNGIEVKFEDELLSQYKKYRYKFLVNKNILSDRDYNYFLNYLKNF